MFSKPTFTAILAGSVFLTGQVCAWAAETAGSLSNVYYLRAEQAFLAAQASHLQGTNALDAWQLGRAAFEFGSLATNDHQRAEIARLGIAACRQAIARQTDSAPAYYFLATNLGELARAEAPSLAAYRLVHEVERAFLKAAELDVRIEHAGPARSLGELYFKAPGWPLSIGSNRKAREWFEAAVRLEPGYPGNQLNLAEARLEWREPEKLADSLKNIAAIWPSARTNFSGEAWESAWAEWNQRRSALESDYQKNFPPQP